MENKNPIWSRIWLQWFVLSLVYLLFYAIAKDNIFVFILGIFVPFGFWNGTISLEILGDIFQGNYLILQGEEIFIGVVALFIMIVIFSWDKLLNHFIQLDSKMKTIVNLLVLLLLTMLIDFVIWGQWASLGLITGTFNPIRF